jgi:hypothetical protein
MAATPFFTNLVKMLLNSSYHFPDSIPGYNSSPAANRYPKNEKPVSIKSGRINVIIDASGNIDMKKRRQQVKTSYKEVNTGK